MADDRSDQSEREPVLSANRRFAVGLSRAFGGAVIFSLPILMTMEMWYLGFYMDRLRLALFLLLGIPLLVGLSYYSGFEDTTSWKEDIIDAFVAYAVGFVAAAGVLALFSVIDTNTPISEVVGKVSLQAVPGSIGAMLAQSQLGIHKQEQERKKREAGYGGEIFLMAVGALFLALNLAPTEEMLLIGYKMTEWHAIALALISMLIIHAFVYTLQFRGQADIPPGTPFWSVFLRFTVVGYAIALLISLYTLWTFGSTGGLSAEQVIMATVVHGFPAAIGAAAARLIL
jgi:putative integral membrane protein (TIGR02587 family)